MLPASAPDVGEDATASALEMRGRGAGAYIVDAAGAQVWKASAQTPLYGLHASPDGRNVLMDFGDGRFEVRTVASLQVGDRQVLPLHPAHPAATAFGQWWWLDGERLLGVSEVPAAADPSLTAAEAEAQPPRATLLAVFDRSHASLVQVGVDPALPQVFHLARVRDDWIELRVEGREIPYWARLDDAMEACRAKSKK